MADIKYLDKTGLGTVKSILEGLFAPKSHKHTVADISNFPSSLPASDVYSWAKATTKPSYSFSEINAGNATIGDGANSIFLRTSSSWASSIYHHTSSDEAVVFLNKGKNVSGTSNYTTSWIFAYGTPADRPAWTSLTPALQIKGECVAINKLIGSQKGGSYNLDINGSANATTLYENGSRVSILGHNHDDRYYTESEIDTKLAGKSNTGHSHSEIGNGALVHMCSLSAIATYNAYKITTNWDKSWNVMPTINIRGYAYGSEQTIDCDIVIYHYNNAACSYSITNKGSYDIKVYQAIENNVQVFYINPGEYYGMFNVFVYSGLSTSLLSGWTMEAVDAIAGTEIPKKAIATSITGNAATATYATTAGSAPASDVYSWAKAANKPSYNFGEIGAGIATIGDGANRLMFRTHESYRNGIYYSTPGNEALVFATKNSVTSWIFATTDPNTQTAWNSLTPSLQIKNGRVTINKLIPEGGNASYNLDVNGSANATTLYENGTRVALSGHTHDDRYYTEGEIDTKLAGKANTGHGHDYLPLAGGTMEGNVSWKTGTGLASCFPAHIYRNTYDNDGNVYDHYYKSDTSSTNSFANLRVKSGTSFKLLRFGGDGTFTWDSKSVSLTGHTHTKSQITDFPTSLPANGGNADTIGGKGVSDFARFYLSPMSSGAPADSAKSWFTDTMPSGSGAIVYNVPGAEKTIIAGKSSGAFGHMLQLNYDDNYLRILRYYSGSWKTTDWEKISAGYADTAGSAVDQTARNTANSKWTYNEDTIKAVKVNNAGSADSATQAGNSLRLMEYYNLDRNHDNTIIKPNELPVGIINQFTNSTGANSSFTWNTIVSMSSYSGGSSSGAGYRAQFLFPNSYSADSYDKGTFYIRYGVDDTWKSWTAIVTAGNIGSYALTSLPSHTHDDTYLKLSGGTMTGCITTPGNDSVVIKPAKNNYDQVGSSDYKFWKIFATTFYGNLSGNVTGDVTGNLTGSVTGNCSGSSGSCTGNAATATKATNDSDGNAINSTYLKLAGGTLSGELKFGDGAQGMIKYGTHTASGLKGITLPGLGSAGIGIFSRAGKSTDEGGIIITEDSCLIYNSFDAGWGFSIHDKDLNQSDISSDATKVFGITQDKYYAWSRGGYKKEGSSDSYVLLGGGGHKAISDFLTSLPSHTHTKAQITDFPTSLPASDVYSWAKAASKPSYNFGEIDAGVATIGDGSNRIMFRTNASYKNGIYYSTPGNEALVFGTVNPVTSWIFATTDPTSQTAWTSLTPSLQIKNGKVAINKLIASGVEATYNLEVNGNINASNGFFDTSDERLKDFYDDIDVDFDKLKSIPKKYFSWKNDENKEIHLGTSAQEIQKVYPEIVNESADGELSVDYSKLSVVALAAVDKLYDKINKIEQALIDKGIL